MYKVVAAVIMVVLGMFALILLLGRVTPIVHSEEHAGVRVKCDPKTGRCKPYPVLAGSCTSEKGSGRCRPRPARPGGRPALA
jgi:murein endopeptidase